MTTTTRRRICSRYWMIPMRIEESDPGITAPDDGLAPFGPCRSALFRTV